MYGTHDELKMMERRVSLRVFKYYFPAMEAGEVTSCPFCSAKRLRVTGSFGESRIYQARCSNCGYAGTAADIIRDLEKISQEDARMVMRLFDGGGGDEKKIEEEIGKMKEPKPKELHGHDLTK
jgi:transcription elongation factor Elf1